MLTWKVSVGNSRNCFHLTFYFIFLKCLFTVHTYLFWTASTKNQIQSSTPLLKIRWPESFKGEDTWVIERSLEDKFLYGYLPGHPQYYWWKSLVWTVWGALSASVTSLHFKNSFITQCGNRKRALKWESGDRGPNNLTLWQSWFKSAAHTQCLKASKALSRKWPSLSVNYVMGHIAKTAIPLSPKSYPRWPSRFLIKKWSLCLFLNLDSSYDSDFGNKTRRAWYTSPKPQPRRILHSLRFFCPDAKRTCLRSCWSLSHQE